MPRRPPLALRIGLTAGLAAACASGAAGPLSVEPVAGLAAARLSVCSQVTGALPREIAAGIERRTVRPTSPTTAAWGDPAVILRCGVEGGSLRDELYTFDDVRWAMHDTGASRTWTTIDRAVHVSVVIPDAYEGQAELLGGLAEALKPTDG